MLDLNRNFDDGLALQTAQALSAYEPPVKVEPAVCDYIAPTCFADIDTKMRDESREDFALSEGFEQFWRVLDPAPGNFRWQGQRVIGIIAESYDYDREMHVRGVWTEDDVKHMGVQVNDLDWDHSIPYQSPAGLSGQRMKIGQTVSGAVSGIAEMTQEAWAAIEPEPDAMAGLAINSESVQRARQRVDAYRMMIERRNTRPEPRRFTRVTLERDEMLRMAMAETRHPAWRTS